MTDDRWREVDELFARALELPPEERARFLARSCGDDPAMRTAIRELLEAADHSEAFLEASIEDLCDLPWRTIFPPPPDASPGKPAADGVRHADRSGERVGAYRLVGRIARGGMGSVYLAQRADGLFEQRVAVKLLRRGWETEDLVHRFVAERQILSSLEHPNIARLLDGGTTDEGLPYLVMELVEGTPIVAYCDERALPVEERLRLFCDVGRAVHHAHRSLIVHRDLKPSNILVDEAGRVKLLDFGIAKLIAEDGDVEATRAGLRRLTLAYASPEQVRGDRITTASDVYQLGLLLCELLSGRLPYDVRALSPARAERQITESEPARPGSLVTDEAAAARGGSAGELTRRLSGDLDLIVLQALAKDPETRYASAEALVDDIDRHLRGEPVRARPQTVGYRVAKFVGRHRTGVAAAALLIVMLLGSAIMASVQARRLAIERDRAVLHESRAQRVTEFLTGIFRVADPNVGAGDSVSVTSLLERGAERALRELEGDPRAQADVLSSIGSMYLTRGLKNEAAPLLERAVELDRTLDDEPASLVRDLRRLASALFYDDQDRVVALVEEAIAVAEAEFGPDDVRVAEALTHLAEISGADPARAHAALERALGILRAQPGDVREQLASALHLSALGRGIERFDRLEEALEIRRSLFGEDHTGVAATLNDMALAVEPFDPAAADTLLEQAAEINVRIHGPLHHQSISILNNLAGRYRDRGDFAKAESLYRDVLRRRREAYPSDTVGHAYTLHGLGWSLTELGRPEEAEPLLRDVVRLVDPATGRTTSAVQEMARSTLGHALARQGRYAEAEPLLRDSYEWMAIHAPNPNFLPFMLDRLIRLYDAWGEPAQADHYRAVREEWERTVTTESAGAGDGADS